MNIIRKALAEGSLNVWLTHIGIKMEKTPGATSFLEKPEIFKLFSLYEIRAGTVKHTVI